MTGHPAQIGFSSQRLRIEWMDYAVRLAQEGATSAQVHEALLALLSANLAGEKRGMRGSREKAATIIMRTWIRVPCELNGLRDTSLSILGTTDDRGMRIATHWAMLGASYPFWFSVAANTGRLLRLQETITAAQIQLRLRESHGDRELVARATRTVLRSFIEWGVLAESDGRGTYSASSLVNVEDPRLVAGFAEALLYSSSKETMGVHELHTHPALFPFHLGDINPRSLTDVSHRLEVHDTGRGEVLALTKTGNHSIRSRTSNKL